MSEGPEARGARETAAEGEDVEEEAEMTVDETEGKDKEVELEVEEAEELLEEEGGEDDEADEDVDEEAEAEAKREEATRADNFWGSRIKAGLAARVAARLCLNAGVNGCTPGKDSRICK